MAATALVLVAPGPLPVTESGMPAIFGSDEMRALAYKTLARACLEAPAPEAEWISAEESILTPR